ncbi:MAG: TIGR00341 family protein [Planctomycetota bacterium]|jgi:uncharacterized hydrophobic protein (TIGR00341 family)
MALRLVEIFIPKEKQVGLFELLETFESVNIIQKETSENQLHTKLLMRPERTEELLDRLEARFSNVESFRIVIVGVEATIPRYNKKSEQQTPQAKSIKFARVSREELYHDIEEASELSYLFVTMLALSSVVAAIGLMRNNPAVVIGAMVIAPLLGPNIAMALASALGDLKLAKTAKRANLIGIIAPLLFAAIIGAIFNRCDVQSPEILSRTEVSLADIVLALAAGIAGTLSFTMSLSGAIIGVMVAVALLPPLVTCGILLGCGQWQLAMGAGLLFATNLICVNLAGVVTFLIQGIRPLWWWEKQRAQKAIRRAMTTWLICLALLILLIIASQHTAEIISFFRQILSNTR